MAWCFYCKRTLNDRRTMRRNDRNRGLDFTIDHKIPLCRGGPDTANNKTFCCHRCNNLKDDMTADEFFKFIEHFGFERQPWRVKQLMKTNRSYSGNW